MFDDHTGTGPDGRLPLGERKLITSQQLADAGYEFKNGEVVPIQQAPRQEVAAAGRAIAAAADKNDIGQMLRCYGDLTRGLDRVVGVHLVVNPDNQGAVTTKGLPDALRSGAKILQSSPSLQRRDLGLDPAAMNSLADQIQHCDELVDIHQRGRERVKDFLTPRAKGAVKMVRTVYQFSSLELLGNETAERDAEPMLKYLEDPIHKAQQTKDHVDQMRDQVTHKVVEKTQSQAREQARKEVLEQVTDSLKNAVKDPEKK